MVSAQHMSAPNDYCNDAYRSLVNPLSSSSWKNTDQLCQSEDDTGIDDEHQNGAIEQCDTTASRNNK